MFLFTGPARQFLRGRNAGLQDLFFVSNGRTRYPIMTLIRWSGKYHQYKWIWWHSPLARLTFTGYSLVFTSNLAIIYYQGWDRRVLLASGQAGKPNRNCQRLIPYSSEYSSFDRLFKFAQLTNCKRTTVLLAQNRGKLVANNDNGPTEASSFFASTASTTPAILTSLVRVDETN